MNIRIAVALTTAVIIAGCTGMKHSDEAMMMEKETMMLPKDGDLAMPADYAGWPVFAADIDKEKNKQVRDIYINTRGVSIQKGEMFPPGTQFVMALHNAEQNADGSLAMAGGKLVKGSLGKIFIMEKGAGWGASAPVGKQNGDWIYAVYNADGSKAEVDYNACRDCHMPHGATDYVFHYDQYFSN
jgi:hemoglobin